MNRFFVSSSAFPKHFLINRTSSITFSTTTPTSTTPSSFWKSRIFHVATNIKPISLNCKLFRVQFLSTTTTLARGKQSRKKKKLEPNPEHSPTKEEKDAFYVVRKGEIIGLYKTLSDCQAQVGSSVCDPSVSVFKGYSLPSEAEEYLISRGFKNAMYTINAADAKEDLFGALVPCPFQEVSGSLSPDTMLRKHQKSDNSINTQQRISNCVSCTLELDGACKKFGAVLKADDGSLVWRLREGVGIATCNIAEYRGVILGLRHALKLGFKRIREFNSDADSQANLGVKLPDGQVEEICEEK